MFEGGRPTGLVKQFWNVVVSDMEETAEQYREMGWETVEVHPGDVTPLDGSVDGQWGLDVVGPDSEIDVAHAVVNDEGTDFSTCSVYRMQVENAVFVVVVEEDPDGEQAVLYPAYYGVGHAKTMLEKAREAGEMRTFLRNLKEDPVMTFSHEDPDLFAPVEDPLTIAEAQELVAPAEDHENVEYEDDDVVLRDDGAMDGAAGDETAEDDAAGDETADE